MSWFWNLNPEVRQVIAGFTGIALVCIYALGVMLVRWLRGKPISGLPPKN